MSDAPFLTGRLLLAMPGMGDSRFEQAVIALCVHDENGALGIGIGHIRDGTGFHAVLDELGIDRGVSPDAPVHHGGPVEPGRGFILHSADWMGKDSIEVPSLGALSASLEILTAIAEGRGPEKWLMALGYAGWGAGQLDEEMHRHGWHAAEGRSEILFETPPESRWVGTWRAEGIDPALLSTATGSA